MFDDINNYIRNCASFTVEEISFFDSVIQSKKYNKKTLLLKEGDVCNFEMFVNKGCIRSYCVDENGNETTLQFATENWWVSDIASFNDRTPSHMFIETLEPCEVFVLTPETKEKLLNTHPKFERLFRILVQRNLTQLQERLIRTISASATEKYLDFLKRYPDLPNRIAQHYIASYLGFTPEFLSKVRTRLAKANS